MSDLSPTNRLTVTAPTELAYPFADQFSAHLTTFPPEGELVIDLRHVDVIDSSGLRVLLVERSRRERAGGTISLTNPTPLVVRLLEVTGVKQVFPVH